MSESYTCDAPTSSNGSCSRTVSSENEYCWQHEDQYIKPSYIDENINEDVYAFDRGGTEIMEYLNSISLSQHDKWRIGVGLTFIIFLAVLIWVLI